MTDAYHITDEPKPGNLSHFTVNPVWPFFTIMFSGVWLSWPWFLINGMAIGSPTFRKELLLVIIGFIGSAVISIGILFIIGSLAGKEVLSSSVGYINIAVLGWKLFITYWLYTLQLRTFEIYQYYGGITRNGILLVVGGALISPSVLKSMLEISPYLIWIMR